MRKEEYQEAVQERLDGQARGCYILMAVAVALFILIPATIYIVGRLSGSHI